MTVSALQLNLLAGPKVSQPVQDGVMGLVRGQLVEVDQRTFGERIPVRNRRPFGCTRLVTTGELSQRSSFGTQVLVETDDEPANYRGQLVWVACPVSCGRRGEIVDVVAQEQMIVL